MRSDNLTPRERARLKAKAHALEPVVHVGQGGVTDAVAVETARALEAHELIKVRMNITDRDARDEACADLAARTGAALVGRVGKIGILWKDRLKTED